MPLAVGAQPVLEQFRFDPPSLCPRDTFRFGFSYQGLPGGLVAVRDVVMEGVWEGPSERPFRSFYSPTREDLAPYTTDEARFESRRLHAGPPPTGTLRGAEVRYTLRATLVDGREVTSATSVRYVDACPSPALYTTLAAGATGRIGFRTTTPTISEFLQGVGPAATTVIWGDLELPAGPVARRPAVVLVHGSAGGLYKGNVPWRSGSGVVCRRREISREAGPPGTGILDNELIFRVFDGAGGTRQFAIIVKRDVLPSLGKGIAESRAGADRKYGHSAAPKQGSISEDFNNRSEEARRLALATYLSARGSKYTLPALDAQQMVPDV